MAAETWTVGRSWSHYRIRVVPKDAGEVQVVETRRAFYGGGWALLCHLLRLGLLDFEAPEIRQLHEEYLKFNEAVERGEV